MKNLIIGTAGHIDHGKTSLVRALTGIDADRFEEEKRRGITIDIGFAHMELGDFRIGFIDVPGHEKFVKNMLAGIGGVRLVLLVVAADESVMPQTREHFQICRLLKIERGIVVLTKKSVVDPELVQLVEAEIEDLVEGSFLEKAPILSVDSVSGDGIEDLKSCIHSEILKIDLGEEVNRAQQQIFRLPVDRVFSVKGFGTVVTGTALSGSLDQDELVEIQPESKHAKIRGIQVFGEQVERAFPGQRTALNLSGIETEEISRGMSLCSALNLSNSSVFDVEINLLPDSPTSLKYRSPIRFHHGSSEIVGRIYPLKEKEIEPGTTSIVQVRLDHPTLCFPGDRFVLRRYSPLITVGGGLVLDNSPQKHRKRDLDVLIPQLEKRCELLGGNGGNREAALLGLIIDQASWHGVSLRGLIQQTGFSSHFLEATLAGVDSVIRAQLDPPIFVSRNSLTQLKDAVTAFLESYHHRNPLSPGVPREELKTRFLRNASNAYFQFLLAQLQKNRGIEVEGSTASLPGNSVELSEKQLEVKEAILLEMEKGSYRPSTLDELAAGLHFPDAEVKDVFYFLLRESRIVKISEEFVLLPSRLENVQKKLEHRFPAGTPFGVAEFKELFSFSRKYAIPFLEFLDRQRVTRRQGDKRIIIE